jgi:predicted nucleic-acid-binding protein
MRLKSVALSIAVDTNVPVRYLTWDDEAQAEAAAGVIESGEVVAISVIVLCEFAWVLRRAYRYRTSEIADAIRRVVISRNVDVDRHAVEACLRMLAHGGDFADGIVQTDATRARCRHIVTFDQDFARLLDPGSVVLLGVEQP